jgi:alkylation response protein AidB-like acyl-CoA dehydrogenase
MILSEKHQLMQKLFRSFAETEFTPALLDRLESTGEFNRDIHNKMAKAGFMGAKIPTAYGGQGGDNLTYVLMVEELARISPVLSLYANTSNSLGAGPLLFCGTEEQKQKYLPPVASGEKVLVFALTEPDAGSDAGGTRTTAVSDGDYFVLNGRKTFISGAPFADYAVVYAKTDPTQRGSRGISMFILDMTLPGVSCGKPEHKMGIIGYPTSDIIMEDVRVQKSDLLGPLHNGFTTAMKTLDGGRLGVAAQAVGIAQGCLDESIKYAKERKQFGQRIANFQAISFMIADMATELEAARELVYSTALMKDAGNIDATMRCSMSKSFAAEACNRIAYKAVQIHGGYGYIKDYRVERLYRDARITTIYEGTTQVQQMVISGILLK